MDKRFDKLLSLHVDDKITSEQFKQQNERIVQQQQELSNRKAELIVFFKARQDLPRTIAGFQKRNRTVLDPRH